MNEFDYYDAELQAYKKEIDGIELEVPGVFSGKVPGVNLTHEAFRHRVRVNFVAVSMISLVEYRLYDIARALSSELDATKVRDLPKLLNFLATPTSHSTGAALPRGRDIEQLPSWSQFRSLREIRHPVVHCFGDITLAAGQQNVRNAIESLHLKEILVGNRRLCFTTHALRISLEIVTRLMGEISAQDKAS